MNRERTRLRRTLEVLVKLYEALEMLCNAKRDALVAHDIERIQQRTEEEHDMLARIQKVDKARAEMLESLLTGQDSPTLTMLIDATEDESESAELTGIREHLRKLGMEVARINRLNTQLCGQALKHLNGFVSALANGNTTQGTYDKQGIARAFTGGALISQSG